MPCHHSGGRSPALPGPLRSCAGCRHTTRAHSRTLRWAARTETEKEALEVRKCPLLFWEAAGEAEKWHVCQDGYAFGHGPETWPFFGSVFLLEVQCRPYATGPNDPQTPRRGAKPHGRPYSGGYELPSALLPGTAAQLHTQVVLRWGLWRRPHVFSRALKPYHAKDIDTHRLGLASSRVMPTAC